ncbi:unnamed protein product [Vitrella brassicaformis CCMP3155]|uniref:Sushi domain-containing protein n=7 Tax=Vitrella brassicaformis TaxID=1169539 RepID=A0A0G4F592_VITBC|nr:unnamed protein product [Vitrella brassicaformis CCMP3155]|eukprot:CEM07649.1 unnamed protein product [Vitrella brassicaformis CCMP3155]
MVTPRLLWGVVVSLASLALSLTNIADAATSRHLKRVITVPLSDFAEGPSSRGAWARERRNTVLSELRGCEDDTDCGNGRSCYKGKCTGFAGSDKPRYECTVGAECTLPRLPGHFDLSVRGATHRVQLLADASQSCGRVDNREERAASCVPSSERSCVPHSLGVVEEMRVYRLCGCPNVDVGGDGVSCSEPADYPVPLGQLAMRGFTPVVDPYYSSSGSMEEKMPHFYCESHSLCFLTNIDGVKVTPKYRVTLMIHQSGQESEDGAVDQVTPVCGRADTPGLIVHQEEPESVHAPLAPIEPARWRNEGFLVLPNTHSQHHLNLTTDTGLDAGAPPSLPLPAHVLSWPCLASGSEDETNCRVNLGIMTDAMEATLCGCADVNNCTDPEDFTSTLGRLTVHPASHMIQIDMGYEGGIGRPSTHVARRLQAAGNASPPNATQSGNVTALGAGGKCQVDGDCFSGFGVCTDGRCRGLEPDLTDSRMKICVEGYFCQLTKDDLPGSGIDNTFVVAAISPHAQCGAGAILPGKYSMFQQNVHPCEAGNTDGCEVNFGVGFRRNASIEREGVRLCGCPGMNVGPSETPCDEPEDYRVPLGMLGVQECTDNQHCTNKLFAYCTGMHCGGFLVTAAQAGITAYQCVMDQQCTIAALASNATREVFKVVPLALSQECGADRALDPDYIDSKALPCLFDVDKDNTCDINLGTDMIVGTNRMCGCSGQDLGGDGIPCNQEEDFDADLGILSVGECVLTSECADGEFCVDGECQKDTYPPFVESTYPRNNSVAIPPLKEITMVWNENVEVAEDYRRIVLINTNNQSQQYDMMIGRKPSGAHYDVKLDGQKLTVIPDQRIRSLPPGDYLVAYELGIVKDLQGNWNGGRVNYRFSLRKDAGCPFIYVTGFLTPNGNANGLYTSIEPQNGKASWRGGEGANLFLYWRKKSDTARATWLIDNNLETDQMLALADPDMVAKSKEPDRPMSGSWLKFYNKGFIEQRVHVKCAQAPDKTPPTLIDIKPAIGARDVPIDTEIVMRFDEPVTWGHWAAIVFAGRHSKQNITIIPDFEAGMRQKYIISNQTRDIVLKPPEPFFYGEVYDIIVYKGAVTDLAYNPWGPVKPDTLVFRTYGVPCSEYGNLGTGYKISGRGRWHGATRQVSCADGFSAAGENQTQTIDCINGEWSNRTLECKADCGFFQDMGTQYTVEGDGTEHGTELQISCGPNYAPTEGEEPEPIGCNDGKWGTPSLRCGPTCGPFPSLGIRYEVDGTGTTEGDKRTVVCADGATRVSGKEPETVGCGGSPLKWTKLGLSCKGKCGPFPEPTKEYIVKGKGTDHGTTYNISCAEGFASRQGEMATSTCEDGRWSPYKLECERSCGKYDPDGNGYAIEGDGQFIGDTLSLSCKSNATLESGKEGEEVSCRQGGAWSLKRLICRGACPPPTDQFGPAYMFDSSEATTTFKHESTASLLCSASASPSEGTPPARIVCRDGVWVGQGGGEKGDKVPLKCHRLCKDFSAPSRYEVTGYGLTHGSTREVRCQEGYDASGGSAKQTITCRDGKWDSKANLTCKARCSEDQLSPYRGTYDISPQKGDLTHLAQRTLMCKKSAIHTCGPKHYTITCRDGRFDRPATICSFPSCSDGVKSGDEEGVDCGGSCSKDCSSCSDGIKNGDEEGVDCGKTCGKPCPPSCTDGIKNGEYACPKDKCPSCQDKLKNGDEEGTDCGGSCKSPCKECKAPFKTTNKAYRATASHGGDHDAIDHGDGVEVECAKGYYQAIGEVESDKDLCTTEEAECDNGVINTNKLRLVCKKPTCDDGVANGDETGVDCGGSCDRACVSCTDGVQNGNEKGIDCGGSDCRPCRNCGEGDFKALDTSLYTFEYKGVNGSAHGDVRIVDCAPNVKKTKAPKKKPKKGSAEVKCKDGQFEPSIREILRCEKQPLSGHSDTEDFSVPVIGNSPDVCKGHEDGDDGCCGFLPALFDVLEGECGAWLYGESDDKVRLFCEGGGSGAASSCRNKINNTIIKKYEGRKGHMCDDVKVGRALLESWCYQSPSESESSYCFASAGQDDDNFSIDRFALKRPSQLDTDCPTDSCFRSNLRYFRALHKLAGHPHTRRLSMAPTVARDIDVAGRVVSEGGLDIDGVVGGLVAPVMDYAGVADARRRRLSTPTVEDYLGGFTERTIDLMCLRDDPDGSVSSSERGYCAKAVQKIADSNPVTMQPRDRNGALDPCVDPCFTLVARRLGEVVADRGVKHNDPHDKAMGSLLVSYGRFFCQKNDNGRYCGEYLFQYRDTRNKVSYIPASKRDYPDCRCPVEYIGDGACDAICFNAACDYDREDCFFRNMFPHVDERLAQTTRLDTITHSLMSPSAGSKGNPVYKEGVSAGADDAICSPFHPNFSCVRTDSPINCKNGITAELEDKGCCLGPLYEVLREALRLDSGHPALPSPPKWQLDRSLAWIEQKCAVTLDRTCAHGLRRQIVKTGLTLDNLDYDLVVDGVNGTKKLPPIDKALQLVMQQTVAKALGVLPSDVIEVRLWPGSVHIEMAVDVGAHAKRVKQRLKVLRETGKLGYAIRDGLADMRSLYEYRLAKDDNISLDPEKTYITTTDRVTPKASSSEPAPLPFKGTIGMGEFQKSLAKEDCPDLVPLDVPEEAGQVYNVTGRGTRDGSTRTITCTPTYEPVGATIPQTVTCDNGRWLPPRNTPFVLCRKPCKEPPYNGTQYLISGVGEDHGSTRTLSCNDGFVRAQGKDPETVKCNNGKWATPGLVCEVGVGCPKGGPRLGANYTVAGSGQSEDDVRTVKCAGGYAPAPGSPSQRQVRCDGRKWVPTELDIRCVARSFQQVKADPAPFPVWAILLICFTIVGAVAFGLVSPCLYRRYVRPYVWKRKQLKAERAKAMKGIGGEPTVTPAHSQVPPPSPGTTSDGLDGCVWEEGLDPDGSGGSEHTESESGSHSQSGSYTYTSSYLSGSSYTHTHTYTHTEDDGGTMTYTDEGSSILSVPVSVPVSVTHSQHSQASPTNQSTITSMSGLTSVSRMPPNHLHVPSRAGGRPEDMTDTEDDRTRTTDYQNDAATRIHPGLVAANGVRGTAVGGGAGVGSMSEASYHSSVTAGQHQQQHGRRSSSSRARRSSSVPRPVPEDEQLTSFTPEQLSANGDGAGHSRGRHGHSHGQRHRSSSRTRERESSREGRGERHHRSSGGHGRRGSSGSRTKGSKTGSEYSGSV